MLGQQLFISKAKAQTIRTRTDTTVASATSLGLVLPEFGLMLLSQMWPVLMHPVTTCMVTMAAAVLQQHGCQEQASTLIIKAVYVHGNSTVMAPPLYVTQLADLHSRPASMFQNVLSLWPGACTEAVGMAAVLCSAVLCVACRHANEYMCRCCSPRAGCR